METPPKMSRDEFINHMREKMEATLGQVADALNDAPPGRVIACSKFRFRGFCIRTANISLALSAVFFRLCELSWPADYVAKRRSSNAAGEFDKLRKRGFLITPVPIHTCEMTTPTLPPQGG